MLFDDGTHGDEQAGDGIYTNCIDKTRIAGSYNIRFSISGVSPSGANFKRKMVSTATVKPGQIDPAKALVRVDPSVIDVKEGSEGIITIVPMDRFGNVWGPGFASKMSVSTTAGVLSGGIIDNGDGFYFQKIRSTGAEETGRMTVTIDDIEMKTKPVLKFQKLAYRSISMHAGVAIPTGSFNNNYDPDYSFGLNFDYHFTPQFSVLGLLGYNHFDSGSPSISDTYCWNISANLKYEFTTNLLTPYVNGGLGMYIPESGSTKPGFNVGLGLDYSLSSDWIMELGADYHHVFTSGSDTQFFVPHVGLIYRF
jgi:opacity protein-like surface antigen